MLVVANHAGPCSAVSMSRLGSCSHQRMLSPGVLYKWQRQACSPCNAVSSPLLVCSTSASTKHSLRSAALSACIASPHTAVLHTLSADSASKAATGASFCRTSHTLTAPSLPQVTISGGPYPDTCTSHDTCLPSSLLHVQTGTASDAASWVLYCRTSHTLTAPSLPIVTVLWPYPDTCKRHVTCFTCKTHLYVHTSTASDAASWGIS